MLRDSLLASTLTKVSIGDKMCHMGKMHHMKITPHDLLDSNAPRRTVCDMP